jgi:hypothetical protein
MHNHEHHDHEHHEHHGHEHHSHEHHEHHHHHHEHEHEHEHGSEPAPGEARVECLLHDDAIVVSGDLTVMAAEYEPVRAKINAQLASVAAAVASAGGIIGHIKASASSTSVEMFSITDADGAVSAKISPELTVVIHLAAIVFNIDPEAVETAVRTALKQLTI